MESTGATLPAVDESKAIELQPTEKIGYLALTRVLFRDYPSRSILGAALMISQSFLYNAIFFTYTLVLGKFYGVASESAPLYLIAFAVGNLAGPLTLGHFFDTIGRRKMIAGTYLLSGLLLAVSAVLFNAGVLNAITQTIAWCVIFFFASAGASAAYLTVSEIFPLEVRAKAIAVFFAIAQCFGALGPVIYGALIGDGSQPFLLFLGYLLGAGVMIAGGLVAWFLAVDAEGKSLEDVATPLAAAGAEPTDGFGPCGGSNPALPELSPCRQRYSRQDATRRSSCAALSSSRACARPLSDSPSPASMRASSATRSSSSSRAPRWRCCGPRCRRRDAISAYAATCGRCVTTMTWWVRASRASRRPICTAARPPTPASTSSNTIVVPSADAASTTSSASMTRDSSPPDALLLSGSTSVAAVRGEAELDGVDTVATRRAPSRPTAG